MRFLAFSLISSGLMSPPSLWLSMTSALEKNTPWIMKTLLRSVKAKRFPPRYLANP
jgi:hypothetical protein